MDQVVPVAVAFRRRAQVVVLDRASLDRGPRAQEAEADLLVAQAADQVVLLLVVEDRVDVDNVLPSARVADVGATSKSSSRRN